VLQAHAPASRDRLRLPAGHELVVRFADAFERDDIDTVVQMLTDDAVISMPPQPEWHQGQVAVGRFLRNRRSRRSGPWRFVPVSANRQPAYAYYIEGEAGFRRRGLFVVSARTDGVESITRFAGDGLLSRFEVPELL
jgi:RNA polymerase sigma-70 factor (ECF subfamily)